MLEQLKIKIKTIGGEARYTHREELKQKRICRFERQVGVQRGSGHFRHRKDQPRPEPRQYPEPKDNTQEIHDEADAKFWNLHRYRTVELRREARISHLAYGFLKGIPYEKMEQKTHDANNFFFAPDNLKQDAFDERKLFDLIRRSAKRYHDFTDQEFAQKWAQWTDEAKEYLKKRLPAEQPILAQ